MNLFLKRNNSRNDFCAEFWENEPLCADGACICKRLKTLPKTQLAETETCTVWAGPTSFGSFCCGYNLLDDKAKGSISKHCTGDCFHRAVSPLVFFGIRSHSLSPSLFLSISISFSLSLSMHMW